MTPEERVPAPGAPTAPEVMPPDEALPDAGRPSGREAAPLRTPEARGGAGAEVSPEGVAPTRTSAVWTAAVGATVLLLALAVFVAQNTQRAEVSFLGWHGRAPTAVLLLVACVAGAGLVAVVGIARILQLRHRGGTPGHRLRRRASGDGDGLRGGPDG
jgi:uncharacterized integral membrane protein